MYSQYVNEPLSPNFKKSVSLRMSLPNRAIIEKYIKQQKCKKLLNTDITLRKTI